MSSLNIANHDSHQEGWNRSFSLRVARTGIALIIAAVALLGLVSFNLGTNSDSLNPAQSGELRATIGTS